MATGTSRSPVLIAAGAALAVFAIILLGAAFLRRDPGEDDDRRAQTEFSQRSKTPPVETAAPAGEITLLAFTRAVWNHSALVVDAREGAAYAQGHLPGAVPSTDISDLLKRIKGIKKGQPILVYGQDAHDPGPQRVVDTLAGFGITDVKICREGVAGWLSSHGPMTTTPPTAGGKP
jgi:rhodanese-related sulfurtransferase